MNPIGDRQYLISTRDIGGHQEDFIQLPAKAAIYDILEIRNKAGLQQASRGDEADGARVVLFVTEQWDETIHCMKISIKTSKVTIELT
jgi:hypothetical protein